MVTKKFRVSFSGSDKEIELKKKRADIVLAIMRSKRKSEQDELQRRLSIINTKIRRAG